MFPHLRLFDLKTGLMSISQCIYRSYWPFSGNNQILIHKPLGKICIYIGGSEWIQEMAWCGERWFSVLSVPAEPSRSRAVSPEPSAASSTPKARSRASQAAATAQPTQGHCAGCPCATHIDQVLLEAFPQVFNECSLAGEVFQQDKVLHPDAVPGCQSALHGQPDAVGSQSLQPKNRELGVAVGL